MPIILKPAHGAADWDTYTDACIDEVNLKEGRIAALEAVGATASPAFVPSDHGFAAWTVDPVTAGSSTTPTAGVLYMFKLKMVTSVTIAGMGIHVATAGSGLTSSYLALHDASGARLGVTAAQTTSWQSSGWKAHALVSGVAVTPGTYYGSLLIGNGSSTAPAVARASSSAVSNANLTAPGLRYGTSGTGQTSVPSSVTLSAVAADSIAWFVGLF